MADPFREIRYSTSIQQGMRHFHHTRLDFLILGCLVSASSPDACLRLTSPGWLPSLAP